MIETAWIAQYSNEVTFDVHEISSLSMRRDVFNPMLDASLLGGEVDWSGK
jgi:hypothetical protein